VTDLRIPIGDLVDMYAEEFSDPDLGTEIGWPTLYRIDALDRTWLTDRFWLLPESVCNLPSGIRVETLPEVNLARVAEWLTALLTAELSPCVQVFAPCFAGTFTLARLRAHAIGGQPKMSALVTGDGERVGILMPHANPSSTSLSLPCADETVAMFHRINGVGVVRYWQAWHLAACLTADLAESAS
jgi:hypothetical protein